jgi:hypothetical protein
MTSLGDSATRVDPKSADEVLCFDFRRDGRLDLAVTIASGGTAGGIGFAVFRATPSGWRAALARNGYKLGPFRVGGDLVSSQPVYRRNDPNCCPTGGFDHLRFRWNGVRFVVARSRHTKSFRPWLTGRGAPARPAPAGCHPRCRAAEASGRRIAPVVRRHAC